MTRPTDLQPLRKDLVAIAGDGAAYSVMQGTGELCFPAFVSAIGGRDASVGLITTAPLLIGALLQLLCPLGVRLFASHRRWVIATAALQGAVFIPLIAAALLGGLPTWVMFGLAALYWAGGLSGNPAWSTWVGYLVPRAIRPRYFAWRTWLTTVFLVAGLALSGLVLQYSDRLGGALRAFALLFTIAALARAVSVSFLFSQSELADRPIEERHVPLRELLNGVTRHGADLRVLGFFMAMQIAVQFATPFFHPYMLRRLQLPYLEYIIVNGTFYAAKVLALPALGHLAARWGPRRLLWVGAAAITPMPVLWLVSGELPYLIGLQLASGMAWATYELALFLLLFDAIDARERTSVMTKYNLGNSLAMTAGSLLGGAVLGPLPGAAAYTAVFILSTAGRGAALLLLRRPKAAPWQRFETGVSQAVGCVADA
jgi:MFS family permease